MLRSSGLAKINTGYMDIVVGIVGSTKVVSVAE